jgi:hypothetical protein
LVQHARDRPATAPAAFNRRPGASPGAQRLRLRESPTGFRRASSRPALAMAMVAAVVVVMVVMADADADAHWADMRADHVGIGRARAQHGEGKH